MKRQRLAGQDSHHPRPRRGHPNETPLPEKQREGAPRPWVWLWHTALPKGQAKIAHKKTRLVGKRDGYSLPSLGLDKGVPEELPVILGKGEGPSRPPFGEGSDDSTSVEVGGGKSSLLSEDCLSANYGGEALDSLPQRSTINRSNAVSGVRRTRIARLSNGSVASEQKQPVAPTARAMVVVTGGRHRRHHSALTNRGVPSQVGNRPAPTQKQPYRAAMTTATPDEYRTVA